MRRICSTWNGQRRSQCPHCTQASALHAGVRMNRQVFVVAARHVVADAGQVVILVHQPRPMTLRCSPPRGSLLYSIEFLLFRRAGGYRR